jgi:hypothetical protein
LSKPGEPTALLLPRVGHLMCFEVADEVRIIDPNSHKADRLHRDRIITRPVWTLLTGDKVRTANQVFADQHLLNVPLAQGCLEFTIW